LDELGAGNSGLVELQCNDTSNLHAILAASQGVDAKPTFIIHAGSDMANDQWVLLAPTALYSSAGWNECRIDPFRFHQVASLNSLYDTSAREAAGNTEVCTPGANFFDLNQADYLSMVFPTQPGASTRFTRPTVFATGCQ